MVIVKSVTSCRQFFFTLPVMKINKAKEKVNISLSVQNFRRLVGPFLLFFYTAHLP